MGHFLILPIEWCILVYFSYYFTHGEGLNIKVGRLTSEVGAQPLHVHPLTLTTDLTE